MILQGVASLAYVIEVRVTAWDPSDERNKHAVGEMRAQPIYEDEDGYVYFRNQASNMMVRASIYAQLCVGAEVTDTVQLPQL